MEEDFIPNQGYVYFAIKSDVLTIEDCTQMLGMEPRFRRELNASSLPVYWEIGTKFVEDPYLYHMIRNIVGELLPIKDRLIALKQHYPELYYVLEVVLFKGEGTPVLSLENDTLLFLGEIGAILDCDIYRR